MSQSNFLTIPAEIFKDFFNCKLVLVANHQHPENIQRLFRLQSGLSRNLSISWKYSTTFSPASSVPAATSSHPASSIPAATSTSNQQQQPATETNSSSRQQRPAAATSNSYQQQRKTSFLEQFSFKKFHDFVYEEGIAIFRRNFFLSKYWKISYKWPCGVLTRKLFLHALKWCFAGTNRKTENSLWSFTETIKIEVKRSFTTYSVSWDQKSWKRFGTLIGDVIVTFRNTTPADNHNLFEKVKLRQVPIIGSHTREFATSLMFF